MCVYASTNDNIRKSQWEYLNSRKTHWGSSWILGGGLNNVRTPYEKRGGKIRSRICYKAFRDFIISMDMEENKYNGRK